MHQIVVVLLGSSFTNLDVINHDTLSVLTMNDIHSFSNGAMPHLCVRLGSGKEQQGEVNDSSVVPTRTLMDLLWEESTFPHLYHPEKEPAMKLYFTEYAEDQELAKLSLSEIRKNGSNSINVETVINDIILVKIKLLSTGVCRDSLKDFSLLINSVLQLFWYIAPHTRKFAEKSYHVSTALLPLLNDPTLHCHKAKSAHCSIGEITYQQIVTIRR